jgi:integrase
MDAILPRRAKLSRGHHKAMPFAEVPSFVATLRTKDTVAARALEFAILTAARTNEVLGTTWDEIDLKANVWTVPPERMKGGRQHRVPLCDRAVAILEEMANAQVSAFVFPGTKRNRPLSNMAMEMLLRRVKLDFTTHGFRSSFRDFCGEETEFPREVA